MSSLFPFSLDLSLAQPTQNLAQPTQNLAQPPQNLAQPTQNLAQPTQNLAQPTQTWGRGETPVWMPYFGTARGPVTVNDTIILDNDVALGVARSLVTPRDARVLGTKDDGRIVSDAMALSLQSTTTIATVGYRLIAKSRELELLRAQLTVEKNLVEDYRGIIKNLKMERKRTAEVNVRELEALKAENRQLSKMVDLYSQDMRKQLEGLDRPGKRKQPDHETSDAQAKRAAKKVVMSAIFGSSSDEPQEAVREDPKEDVQKAKLKAPMKEAESAVKK